MDTKDYEKNIGLSFSLSEKFKIKSFGVDFEFWLHEMNDRYIMCVVF